MGAACQQLRQVADELVAAGEARVSVATLRRMVKALGYSWKRMRRSLRAQRDPVLFAFFAHELALLRAAAERGELALVYADECRFSRHAPVPYAWQRRGQPPVELPAERGRGGWSVLGLWAPHTADQPLASWRLEGALTAPVFVAAVDEWSQQLTKPTILVLDNASIHRAACVGAKLAQWRARGLHLQFLPPYCPELNLIEILWRRCKHAWIKPEDYASTESLRNAIDRVMRDVGSTYRVTFD